MKSSSIYYFMVLLLAAGICFASCSKDEEEDDPGITGSITGLTASLSTSNGRTVQLSFDDSAGEYVAAFNGYRVYSSEDGAEFERLDQIGTETSYTDRSTSHGKTYRYYINFENMYSDTIEISTAHPAMPWLSTGYQTDGDGPGASVRYIRLNYFVGESKAGDLIDKFVYYRDGVEFNVRNVSSVAGNSFEYQDESITFNFDQEYTYKVVAHTHQGETFESFESTVTPRVPDEVDRRAPEIKGLTTDFSNERMYLHVNDVSGNAQFIEFFVEIEKDNYFWEASVNVADLSQDPDGNYMIGLNLTDVPNGNKEIKAKARIEVGGTTGDWSPWSLMFLYVDL